MRRLSKLFCTACLFVCGCLPLQGQVYPVPIPGGVIAQFGAGQPIIFINLFFPGVGGLFNGLNAEPHTIINSSGVVAMGYTAGTATDSNGTSYDVVTDVRVFHGEYVSTDGTHHRGTFAFI